MIQGKVKVSSSSDDLLKEIDECCTSISGELKLEDLTSAEEIKDGRDTYKNLGKSPSKYRLSSEALLRRILQGKGLYKVNNIVDINNLISIKSKFPVGSYDVNKIDAHIVLNRAEDGAKYKGIGKEFLNIEHLPVLTDSKGYFGSPTSDCERAMITEEAQEIVMCIYSFSGSDNIEGYLKEAESFLEKYAYGHDFETSIVR